MMNSVRLRKLHIKFCHVLHTLLRPVLKILMGWDIITGKDSGQWWDDGSRGATSGGTMGQKRTVGSRGATSGGTMG